MPKPPASDSPSVVFRASPSRVAVYVDGKRVGRTPMTWRDAQPNRRYAVEYRLNGYDTQRGELTELEAGTSRTFSLTLRKQPGATSTSASSQIPYCVKHF